MAALSDDLKKSGKNLVFLKVEPKLAQVLTGAFSIPGTLAATDDELKEVLKGMTIYLHICL